ncbi:MAG: hypothetical protein COB20_04655, partial [SAR86 cluster bacterium]
MDDRRLAAIMFTDIVGYTSMMAADEQQALRVIVQHREILKPVVEKYNGSWLKEMGDGTLSSFPSSIQAINCAIELQAKLKLVPEFTIRIGIHLGDVIFAHDDVYGDGVNVASRIEPTAAPGGISISGQVYDTITSNREITAEYLGDKNLKHVARPVRIYAISNSDLPIPAPFTDEPPEESTAAADPSPLESISAPDVAFKSNSLFQELRRRKVFRAGMAYVIVAWLLIQVSTAILPVYDVPVWINQGFLLLLA